MTVIRESNLILFLQILLHTSPIISSGQPEIITPPGNVSVGLGHPPVQLICTVRADYIFWQINGTSYDYRSSDDFRDRAGIDINESASTSNENMRTQVLSVSIRTVNNNTNICCIATTPNFDASVTTSTIYIADVPLPPNPVFVGINASIIGVQWEVPFTSEGFPILSYMLEVVNQTNNTVLISSTINPDILFYNLTRVSPPSCNNLTFLLLASNSVGSSDQGTTYGAFPDVPGEFLDSPRTEVIYFLNKSPILEIYFTFPSICPFHNASYSVVIEDEAGAMVHTMGPHIQHWTQSGSLITMEIREGGLAIDTQYMAKITVSTIVGMESITVPFNTTPCCSTITKESISSSISLSMYATAGIYPFILSMFAVSLCIIIYF